MTPNENCPQQSEKLDVTPTQGASSSEKKGEQWRQGYQRGQQEARSHYYELVRKETLQQLLDEGVKDKKTDYPEPKLKNEYSKWRGITDNHLGFNTANIIWRELIKSKMK